MKAMADEGRESGPRRTQLYGAVDFAPTLHDSPPVSDAAGPAIGEYL